MPSHPTGPRTFDLLLLGGSAFLGPHLARTALDRGHRVTLFNRGQTSPEVEVDLAGVEELRGDRDGGLDTLTGRRWDAVIDTSGYFPRVVRDSARLLAGSVGQYVFISSLSVYADSSRPGLDESAPVGRLDDENVEEITGETYGPLKALCEGAAEAEMPGRVTNIRAGLIVGPGDRSDRFTYWPVRIDRGGEVLAPGSPDDPVQIIDVRDLAGWVIHAIEQRHVGVFNATGPTEPLPLGDMLDTCREASGSNARFTWVPPEFLEQQNVQPWSDMPVWIPPRGAYVGFSRFSIENAIEHGLTFRPLAETVRDTLAWLESLPEERRTALKAGLTPEREEEVLKAWHHRNIV